MCHDFHLSGTYMWLVLCHPLCDKGSIEAVAYRGGELGVQTPPEIPKAFQNRAKLDQIVKTVKNC